MSGRICPQTAAARGARGFGPSIAAVPAVPCLEEGAGHSITGPRPFPSGPAVVVSRGQRGPCLVHRRVRCPMPFDSTLNL